MPGVFSYLRSFRHLARTDENDGTLLERFRTQRDEQAFATLVQRHGPLILGIIRRLVGPGDQADDVFQATFLVLAHKGQSMERWPSVAGWLVQVARRTALQAQAKSARRSRHEQQAASMTSHITTSDPARTIEQQDLANALDAELDKLPGKYRSPIILCQLLGQSREETARQLGWPLGSVAGRLARGKKLLQDRLLKRGIVPTLAVGELTMTKLEAQVPALLVQATTLLASHVVHKTSQVPASAAITLAQGVMTSMLMTKVKYTAAALLFLCLCAGTGAWAWSGKGESPIIQTQPPKIETKATSLQEQLQGIWVVEKAVPAKGTSGQMMTLNTSVYYRFNHPNFYASEDIRFGIAHHMLYGLDELTNPARFAVPNWHGILQIRDGKLYLKYAAKREEIESLKNFEEDAQYHFVILRRATDYDRLEGIWCKEVRNPVTDELESAEELIFKKNLYVRRVYHFGLESKEREGGKVANFLLNESASPKQIDLNIRSADEVNTGYARQLKDPNSLSIFAPTIKNNKVLERQVGIYELKDNEFTYQISGAVPFMLQGDKLVPDPQSPLNRRPTAFVPGNNATEAFKSQSVTYKRVEKSLKDSLNLRDAPLQEVPAGATQPNPSPDVSPQILDLKQQRLKVAEERMEHWQKSRVEQANHGYKTVEKSNKQIDVQSLVNYEGAETISQQLLEARLDVARDNEVRIKAYEEHIRILLLAEKASEARNERRSKAPASDNPSSGMLAMAANMKDKLLEIRYRRIEAMIKLEELKAKK